MTSLLNRLNINSEFITETGCQIWLGAVSSTGYGVIKVKGRACKVHRVMYELAHRKIRKKNVIRHLCGVQLYINPAHIRQGTQLQNIKAKKRDWHGRKIS